MTSTIQVRVDEELMEKSKKLFKELGKDTTTAIRMFLTPISGLASKTDLWNIRKSESLIFWAFRFFIRER